MSTSFVDPTQDPRYRYNPALFDPQYDPNNPNDPGGVFTPPASTANTNPLYGNPGATTIPPVNTDPNAPIHNMFYDDQAQIQAGGQQINKEAQSQLDYYGPRQATYGGLADKSLDELKAMPGYNPDEAAKIGVDYGANRTSAGDLGKKFLTSDEQAAIAGDPNTPKDLMGRGTDAEGKMLNAYGANLGGQVGNLDAWTGSAVDEFGNKLDASTGKLDSGLSAAQDKFGKLDTVVNNPALAFDPNSTEKQMTDADVQAIKTAAGERVGNEYRSSIDDLNRSAAAAGITSPLAIAAARARLEAKEAAGQGSAEYQADIAARQAQYGRAADIEGQREGAVKTQTGFQAGAATTEEQKAQEAAALAGTAGIQAAEDFGQSKVNAAETLGKAGIDAANTYGKTSVDTASDMAGKNYTAAATAEQLAAQRAAALGANRQNTQTAVNNTTYGQGVQTNQLNAAGAKTTGDARIAGEGAYRAGVAQQQGMAQQGGQAAVGQQQQAYGTQTQGINQSTGNRAVYENTGPGGLGKAGTSLLGTLLGDEGGVFTEPTKLIIGEKRPEMVIPLSPRYSEYGRRKAA